jgi:Arc/MetJ-type ribon-helix-helix transcriptional regulator
MFQADVLMMATKVLRGLPPDVLRVIDRKIRAGEFASEEEFVEDAVRRRVSELLLDELQRRHGRPGSASPAEIRRIVKLVRSVRRGA